MEKECCNNPVCKYFREFDNDWASFICLNPKNEYPSGVYVPDADMQDIGGFCFLIYSPNWCKGKEL